MTPPSTSYVLSQWTAEPTVIIGLAALCAGYAYAIGPLRRKHNLGPPATRRQIMYFALATLILAFALLSPLDYVGDEYLFSAHMIQHLLLAAIWPPILLISIPDWLVRPIFGRARIAGIVGFVTMPVLALIIFNFDIYLWHLPLFYDATLQNEGIHIVEHLTFLACGLVVWWPVLSPIPEQRLSYPGQIMYLFAGGMFMMILGLVFTFSPIPFYSPYVAAPRLWGVTPVNDQQIGGLIMWYPGNLSYGYMLVVAFYRWFEWESPHAEPAESTDDLIAYNESPQSYEGEASVR